MQGVGKGVGKRVASCLYSPLGTAQGKKGAFTLYENITVTYFHSFGKYTCSIYCAGRCWALVENMGVWMGAEC